jgi:hypothetical protein
VNNSPAPSSNQISSEPHMSWFAASMKSFKMRLTLLVSDIAQVYAETR